MSLCEDKLVHILHTLELMTEYVICSDKVKTSLPEREEGLRRGLTRIGDAATKLVHEIEKIIISEDSEVVDISRGPTVQAFLQEQDIRMERDTGIEGTWYKLYKTKVVCSNTSCERIEMITEFLYSNHHVSQTEAAFMKALKEATHPAYWTIVQPIKNTKSVVKQPTKNGTKCTTRHISDIRSEIREILSSNQWQGTGKQRPKLNRKKTELCEWLKEHKENSVV